MKEGRKDYDKIIRLRNAALEVLHCHVQASPDLRELAEAVNAIYDGADPSIALGLTAPTKGDVPDPERVLMQRHEVRAAVINRALKDGIAPKAACNALADEGAAFTDPLYHGAMRRTKPLSGKSIERIWNDGTTKADRDMVKQAAKSLANSKK